MEAILQQDPEESKMQPQSPKSRSIPVYKNGVYVGQIDIYDTTTWAIEINTPVPGRQITFNGLPWSLETSEVNQ